MVDLNEMVKGIRFDREREFALAFFDHDKWVHEPRYLNLKDGTRYLPDFYDAKRDVYIEVVGSRQAYSVNKNKYRMIAEEYPNMQFELRVPSGDLLELKNSRTIYKSVTKKGRTGRYLKNMFGASRLQEIMDAKKISIEEAADLCGVSFSTVKSHYYGLRKTIRLHIAVKYAEGLGCDVKDILPIGDDAA